MGRLNLLGARLVCCLTTTFYTCLSNLAPMFSTFTRPVSVVLDAMQSNSILIAALPKTTTHPFIVTPCSFHPVAPSSHWLTVCYSHSAGPVTTFESKQTIAQYLASYVDRSACALTTTANGPLQSDQTHPSTGLPSVTVPELGVAANLVHGRTAHDVFFPTHPKGRHGPQKRSMESRQSP
jgi:hypothetical protein